MIAKLSLSAACLLLSLASAVADPTGSYRVAGKSADGDYEGTVTVQKTGDTYRIEWSIGSDKYVGTGIGKDDFLATAYKSGDDVGLAMYFQEGGVWKGVWTPIGSRKLFVEVWSPR